ncbi:MAG: helix-turn-helix domain-containing protein [Streptosporangiales bacterium]|nr:helix-turn-helix domain-containing protein [Streptosporangiales bacterium]
MSGSPTVRRWQLAHELRRLRGDRRLSEVARSIEVAASTVGRWESTEMLPRQRDLRSLLVEYGVSEVEQQRLLELRRDAGRRGWWQRFRLNQSYSTYIGLESEASEIVSYQSQLVPGLFQTPEYMREIFQAARQVKTPEEIEELVQVRMERQQIWKREDAPKFWALLDEAVIQRHVGGQATMCRQLFHLLDVAQNPKIEIQVVPFEAGAHIAMQGGPFVLLRFSEPEFNVVYLEGRTSSLYLDDNTDVANYRVMLDHLRALALSPENSLRLIRRVADGFSRP